MSDIQFDNDFSAATPSTNSPVFAGQNLYNPSEPKGMTGWLLRKGIIKEESQAKVILLGVVLFNVLLTFFIIFYFL